MVICLVNSRLNRSQRHLALIGLENLILEIGLAGTGGEYATNRGDNCINDKPIQTVQLS